MSSFGRFGNNQDHAVGEFSVCIKPLDGKDHARKRALTVKSWSTVKDLKDILQSLLHIPAASQRLFFRGGELRNPHTLQDCGIYRDGQTVYLASSPQDEMGKPYSLEPFLGAGALPRSLARVLGQARRGLDRGFKPELTLEGTGGTYFLQDAARQKVAVFKPQDEEPFAPNNPRDAMQGGLGGGTVSMRPGIDAGESYVREVAAYILDNRHLHGVPPTTLVEAKHPAFCYWDHKERMKLGSFQEFVRHDMVVEDISPSRLTHREVQKIALLDMRILNRDRNSVNILVRSRPRRSSSFSDRSRGSVGGSGSARHVRHGSSDSNISLSMSASGVPGGSSSSAMGAPGVSRGNGSGGVSSSGGERRSRLLGGSTEYELIPIDHGLCLSDELVIDWCDWCWLDWPQVKEPIDPELANYIHSFNPEATAEKLGNTLNLQEPCLRNLRIAETLLKEGVSAGLTLYDIACIIRREDFDKISELETLVARANELARAAVDHQTSVAPSKRTLNLTPKSVDASKVRPRRVHRNSSSSVDFAAEDKEGWLITAAQEEAIGAERRPHPRAPALRRESSTDASSEDVPSLPDLRVSGDSMEGSGGEGAEGPLRIWAPGTATLSRESSSSADVAFLAGRDDRYSSSTRSPESDAELMSPVGFWHEKFETIDARNATRRFSGWGDNDSGEEVSPEGEGGKVEGVGGRGNGAGWVAGGCPPRKDGDQPRAAVRDQPEAGGVDVGVGRKLFASPEKQRPPPPVNKATKPLSANLEPMAEGDHESPSPMGPPGGGPHPPSFWAAPIETARGTVGRVVGGAAGAGAGGGLDEKEAGGLGWRRGEAGLVVPQPLPPKSRSVTIQQVVPKRAPRIVDAVGGGGGEEKYPLSAPRPATTSPTLPTAGEHKSKAPKELHVLSQGVKIVRSYSYHGLGSMALYDSASRGNALYSLRKRPNENSEQFKSCFFRFLRFLLRDLVKRRHRSIVKTRGAQAARHAAEKSSKSTTAAACAASAAGGGRRGDYGTDDRLRGRAPPPPSATGRDPSPRPAVSAAVRG